MASEIPRNAGVPLSPVTARSYGQDNRPGTISPHDEYPSSLALTIRSASYSGFALLSRDRMLSAVAKNADFIADCHYFAQLMANDNNGLALLS